MGKRSGGGNRPSGNGAKAGSKSAGGRGGRGR